MLTPDEFKLVVADAVTANAGWSFKPAPAEHAGDMVGSINHEAAPDLWVAIDCSRDEETAEFAKVVADMARAHLVNLARSRGFRLPAVFTPVPLHAAPAPAC